MLLAMVRFRQTHAEPVLLNTPPPMALPLRANPQGFIIRVPEAPKAEFNAMVQFVAASCAALKYSPAQVLAANGGAIQAARAKPRSSLNTIHI